MSASATRQPPGGREAELGSQVGYVLGLSFLLPLGDLLERRRLITTTMALTAAAMVACGLAPSFVVMLVLAAVLHRALPRVPPTATLRYDQVLRSVLALVAHHSGRCQSSERRARCSPAPRENRATRCGRGRVCENCPPG
ncbi:MAG: hypothetical protein ACRDK8_12140, partial [Solirubrobacteraceae bacterium]